MWVCCGLSGDDSRPKSLLDAHNAGVKEALEYIHQHAGYTHVHNKVTGMKDLQRLPGVVTVTYQHETSRAGDPHLHTSRHRAQQAGRLDGTPAAIDTDSLWHEAKPAG